MPSSYKKSNQKNQKASISEFQQSLRARASGLITAEDERKAVILRDEMKEMLKMFPGSAEFLGRAEYTIKPRKLVFIKRKYPDISVIRDQVNKHVNQGRIDNTRMEIKKLLKKHPAYPDLRALNAIQIYNDSAQSGLDAKKIKVIQGALREITRAMYNGALSLFTVNWFIKIYIRYIDGLKEKYQHEYVSTKNHFSKEVRLLSDELRRKHIQLTVMSTIRSKLSGLTMLNAKLKGSLYTIDNLSVDDVKKASLAIKNEDGTKKIGETGKTANHIIFIIMTLNLLFARIPILDDLVKSFQRATIDANRDLVLQKIMVNNMRRVTEFQLSMASGDRNKTVDIARKMYLDMIDVIKQYLEHGVLSKQYEIDPFIKAVWVVKESKGLFNDSDYRVMLENALKLVEIMFSRRVQVKGADELARNLQDEIHFIMIEAGWMK